ncbi:MAG: hypothetical protein FWG88_07715 [Oscillospiraceae bacterium]|nr:hypothetical protein [Oscillospiraceae bacterium]
MTILQCKICRKPFQSLGGDTCHECLDKIDKDFITVRDYIYENRDAKMDEIIEETGVEKAVILRLLKEGRLKLDNPDSEGMLLCDICRKPITSGRMCTECKNKAASEMLKSAGGNKEPEAAKKELKASKHNAKMHTDITERRK